MFFCARIQMKIIVILPDRGKPVVKINQILTQGIFLKDCANWWLVFMSVKELLRIKDIVLKMQLII